MTVYEIVTDRIIKALEGGKIPWRQTWKSMHAMNFVSKRAYTGINTILLSLDERSTPYWLTFKQATALGGSIKKGEKSSMVVFFKQLEKKSDKAEKSDNQKEEKKGYIPLLRYYRVFNLDQTEGIEMPAETKSEFTPIEKCEGIVRSYFAFENNITNITRYQPPPLAHGGDRCYYSPKEDRVQMPKQITFESPEEYYTSLFHEMTHSTGHEKRLNRPEVVDTAHFGTETYSKEELVAEIGASFLSCEAGIDAKVKDNSVAYLQGWISKLQNDKRLIVSAAAKAQKAADYILGR